MGTRRSLVDERRPEIAELARRLRGRSIAVFGSVARGEDDAGTVGRHGSPFRSSAMGRTP
ncbi:MAG TPA: hypothetical protein VFE55_19205 [Acidimicrobiia bacterium]|nr:hypothetical protein [Acidimicrobiia bacterium]